MLMHSPRFDDFCLAWQQADIYKRHMMNSTVRRWNYKSISKPRLTPTRRIPCAKRSRVCGFSFSTWSTAMSALTRQEPIRRRELNCIPTAGAWIKSARDSAGTGARLPEQFGRRQHLAGSPIPTGAHRSCNTGHHLSGALAPDLLARDAVAPPVSHINPGMTPNIYARFLHGRQTRRGDR